ncbi:MULTISPECIES: hypothetical protein [Clostridia]|uniref:hypothetical protein n=1 Tax=Clostridia TaxID=186801 RepID=UPI002A8825A0|nr:hypothetical protein [Peptostreptococcus porci]MDY5098738.1 hypothetical protein [Clostridium sp.]MDY5437514.1 hypothetical protein [Peptostreptococcus porci]
MENLDKKLNVEIELVGCDDTTEIDMCVTAQELEVLQRVSAMSREESTYSCMPIMEIRIK